MSEGRPLTRAWGMDDTFREISAAETEVDERIADAIARAWDFWKEEDAFNEIGETSILGDA